MEDKIVIRNSDIQKIRDMSVQQMARIIKTGVIEVKVIQYIHLPKDSIQIYMYLVSQNKSSHAQKEQKILQETIEEILINQESIAKSKQNTDHDEKLIFLNDQIIESILFLSPTIINKFQIDFKHSKAQSHKDILTINNKNIYAIGNIIKICQLMLKQAKNTQLSYEQCKNILKKYLIPIYLQYGEDQLSIFNKSILESIKIMLLNYGQTNIAKELSNYYNNIYHAFWKEVSLDKDNVRLVKSIQNHLTLCELIHHHVQYHSDLAQSKILKNHIQFLLQYKGQNKVSIHLLALNIYQKLLKQLNQYNNASEVFINLFGMLSCYGTHLIKDAWLTVHTLIQVKQASLFQHLELVNLIFVKLENHQNSNVIKNCFNELIKHENSNVLFKNIPSLVYSNVVKMMNLGVHCADSLFHMDSKFYTVIASFFLKYYDNPETTISTLQAHLNWLLESISKLGFDHALIAIVQIFPNLKKKTTFIQGKNLDLITKLLKNAYSRYPIRKRYQFVDGLLSLLQNHLNYTSVNIQQVFEFLISINAEYLIPVKLQNLQRIVNKFDHKLVEQWIEKISYRIIQEIKENINYEQEQFDYQGIFRYISMMELYYKLYQVSFPHYEDFFMEMIEDYGQSSYKSLRQREFIVKAYSQIQSHLLRLTQSTKPFSRHLESVLNIIVYYAEKSSTHQKDINLDMLNQIISTLFLKVYSSSKCQDFKERQGERVIVARMLQWANDKICDYRIALQVVIQALRTRNQVIIAIYEQPYLYQHYQHLFQETLFEIYDQITALQQSNWKTVNRLSSLSRDKQLRLKVLLNSILINDENHTLSQNPPSYEDLRDYIDRYDFYNYEEICWLIQIIYTKPTTDNKRYYLPQKFSQEEANNLVKQLQLLVQNMIHNLQYSLSKKEIASISSATVSMIFNMASENGKFYQSLINFAIKLIKIGQNNLIFQRSVALLVIKQLYENPDILSLDCTYLIPLITAILTIQEYRGFDSAIYLFQENNKLIYYREFVSDIQYNYHGTVPRFLFIQVFKNIIYNRKQIPVSYISAFSQIISYVFEMCMVVAGKEKMFLSGKNKIKLQMWQFLLLFEPTFLPHCLNSQNFQQILLSCIQFVATNTISEIRYYSEIFLMRILLNESNFRYITNKLLLVLKNGLFSSIGNVNKSVSYMIISGMLINHISVMSEHEFEHFMNIKDNFIHLYNTLLTYSCSSVAYFRGLSQYYCLQNIAGCLETKYVSILRENYLLDSDAVELKKNLGKILLDYLNELKKWEISKEILSKIPNSNYNVVSNEYYMDKFKALAAELAKKVKNEDGFTAYRYIWKKNISLDQQQEEIQEVKDDILQNGKEQDEVYQRKIDPTFDFIYGSQNRSQLKIVVTSSKSVALLGHMARTGEIFGISELIIPSLKVLEKEDFKSISVTAERWLKITQIGNSTNKKDSLLALLIQHKIQGYQIIKISKLKRQMAINRQFSLLKKCIVILDEQQTLDGQCLRLIDQQLQLSYFFSLHVEASIVIWQYFKKYLNAND